MGPIELSLLLLYILFIYFLYKKRQAKKRRQREISNMCICDIMKAMGKPYWNCAAHGYQYKKWKKI